MRPRGSPRSGRSGPAGSTSCSPWLAASSAWATSGVFPTSATKTAEVSLGWAEGGLEGSLGLSKGALPTPSVPGPRLNLPDVSLAPLPPRSSEAGDRGTIWCSVGAFLEQIPFRVCSSSLPSLKAATRPGPSLRSLAALRLPTEAQNCFT